MFMKFVLQFENEIIYVFSVCEEAAHGSSALRS